MVILHDNAKPMPVFDMYECMSTYVSLNKITIEFIKWFVILWDTPLCRRTSGVIDQGQAKSNASVPSGMQGREW